MQGGRIQANGGVIEGGWFVFDPETLATLRRRHGPGVPARVSAKPRWCNPTPPFAPTLGGHTRPGVGYCDPEGVTEAWNRTWSGFDKPPAPGTYAWREQHGYDVPDWVKRKPGMGAFPEKVDIVLTIGLFAVLGAVIWAYQKPEGARVAR
jgi:hypothetical protein